MAATVALLEATKNHAKYLVTGADTNTVNLDANVGATPSMEIDIPAGPLRDLMVGPYANQAAARTALYGDTTTGELPKVRITHHDETGRLECLVNVTGGGGTARLTLTCRVGATVSTLLIEYIHSLGR